MDADIKVFVNSIKEKMGIEFSVYNADGSLIVGDATAPDTVPTDFDEVKSYSNINKTLFTIKYKNKTFIGAIDGVGQTDRVCALLLGKLAENSLFSEMGLSCEEFYKAIVLGEMNQEQISRYMRKYSLEDGSAFVMVVSVTPSSLVEVKDVLKTYGAEGRDFVVKIDDSQLAFVKFVGDDSDEYRSSNEYAEFLRQSVYEETGDKVRIAIGGTVKTVFDLSSSFAQAMTAVRMSKAMVSKGDVHSFKEYMLIKMLEDLPKFKLNEYLEMLLDSNAKAIFLDEEMTNTAEEFLENSLNVSETSRKLYLHRNTLTYRLDKIEKATGLNIRKFSDAITFRLITVLTKLTNN